MKAPCGHPSVYITPTISACSARCHLNVPTPVDTEKTPKMKLSDRCPFCGSYDVEEFIAHYFPSTATTDGMHCNPCGRVWQKS